MKIQSRDKMTVEEKRMKKGDTILVTSRLGGTFLGKSNYREGKIKSNEEVGGQNDFFKGHPFF